MPNQSALNKLGYSQLARIGHFAGSAPDMSLKTMAELVAPSKTLSSMFQSVLDEAKIAYPLLKAVLERNIEKLAELVKAIPASLFAKGQIQASHGIIFYHVSAYQLMVYLCNHTKPDQPKLDPWNQEMLTQIMALVPSRVGVSTDSGVEELETKAWMEEQSAQLKQGGADLIKLDRDPTTIPFEDASKLMENPNAIIFYKDAQKQVHWYIADGDTKTVVRIEPRASSPIEQTKLDDLEEVMNMMSKNSARRSSDLEHDIIKKTMRCELTRNGIQYTQNGISYHDTLNKWYNDPKFSPLYWLASSTSGRQLLQAHWGAISSTLASEAAISRPASNG